MTVRTRGGKLWLQGGRVSSGVSNRIVPTNADLGFVEVAFNAVTDQEAGTHLFTAQILNSAVFTLQGYSFSNFRRTSGFSKLSGGTEGATSRPFTSNAMVLGDADAVTVTISVDFAGPTSGTISATIPGTIEAPPGSGIVVHQFTLHNTSGGNTTPRARLGLAFEKGAFPDTFKIKVRDQATQTDVAFAALANWNTWADDSYRSTADGGLVMEDSNALTAGSSRIYEAYITNGGQATSGFDPWTWIEESDDDLTVDVTSRTGSSSGALGDLAFSLQTAIATTTRREVLCDAERFVRIKAWQKVSGEEHLICEFHVDFWLDSEGDPVALEVATVLSQHWWIAAPFGVSQTKERQTYNAVVKWGDTTLDSRSSIAHAYYCRWASLRSTDDAQHARKHWIDLGSAAMPTVRVQYADSSLKTMMRAGYIPPLRLGVSYSGDAYTLASTYTPLGTNGHRAGINGTGAYVGRGMWGDPDAKLVCRQSSATAATAEGAWRAARVMAQAGMSTFFHVRDHRSTSGVNGGTDAPNRLIPQTFRKAAALSLNQSYAGLGAHCVYAKSNREETSGLNLLTAHAAPAGGSGAFNSYDTAHAHNYSAPMAFLEGESYLAEAALSSWNHTTFHQHFNRLGADRGAFYYDNSTRRTTEGIPNTTGSGYGTTMDMTQQDRCLAWTVNLLGHAYALRADAHPEQPFIENFVSSIDDLMSDSYGYYPDAHREKGIALFSLAYRGLVSPWMNHWQGMAAYQAARLFDFLPDNDRDMNGFEETAFLAARYVIKQFESNAYSIGHYHHMWGTDVGGYSPVPDDEWPGEYLVTFSSSTATATPVFGLGWTNGDKLRLLPFNSSFAAQTIPSGLTAGTLYYLINVSGNTFQLAATEGGSALTIANQSNVACYITTQDEAETTPVGPNGVRYWPGDDSYYSIAYALFEQAIGEQHPDMTGGISEAGRAFMAPKVADISVFAAWNYDGSNLS